MANVSLPFAIPAHGYALNSKLRVNFDFIVSELNSIVGGSSAFDQITLGTANTTTGTIVMYNASTAYKITIQAGSTGSDITFTLPTSAGSNKQGLGTNGSGVLGWYTYVDTAGSGLSLSGSTLSISAPVSIANGGTNSITALNNNRFIVSSGSKIVEASAVTANRAVITDNNGLPTNGNTTDTEVGYLHGVTSAIQTQLNTKFDTAGSGLSSSGTTVSLSTPISAASGGTGHTSYSQGDLIYASGSTTLSTLAKDTNSTRYLSNRGTSNNPSWSTVDLSDGVNSHLSVANGGTGVTSLTANDLLCAGTTSTGPFQQVSGEGTAGYVLTSNGTSVLPTWQSISGGLTSISSINTTSISGWRNRIINGAMVIDQLNEGASTTIGASATTQYVTDQWQIVTNNNTDSNNFQFTVQQITSDVPTGFVFSLKCLTTSGGTAGDTNTLSYLVQKIEGQNIQDFQFGGSSAIANMALSFWVSATETGTWGGAIQNSAQNRSYVFSYSVNSSGTWEKKTIIIPGDTSGTWLTTNGIGMRIIFDLGSGSTNRNTAGSWYGAAYYGVTSGKGINTNNEKFVITGVQLELGGAASLFEYRAYPLEFMMCQRYYEKSYDIGSVPGSSSGSFQFATNASQTNTTTVRTGWIPFHVTKRTDPSISIWTGAGTSGKWTWVSTGNVVTDRTTDTSESMTNGFNLRQTAALDYYATGHWVADARL